MTRPARRDPSRLVDATGFRENVRHGWGDADRVVHLPEGAARATADHRARLVRLVQQIMCATGKEQGVRPAEALVASYDGVLLAALVRPAKARRAFLVESMQLLGKSLSAVDSS